MQEAVLGKPGVSKLASGKGVKDDDHAVFHDSRGAFNPVTSGTSARLRPRAFDSTQLLTNASTAMLAPKFRALRKAVYCSSQNFRISFNSTARSSSSRSRQTALLMTPRQLMAYTHTM